MSTGRSLKAANFKWLVALVVADLLVMGWMTVPGITLGSTLSSIAVGRIVTGVLVPVVILLLVDVLPHDVKSALVYWRPRGILPGSEAFTKLGPDDPRTNMEALRKRIGTLPTEPKAQNQKWYELFKEVEQEPEIQDAHRHFLLYRDMAILSVPLVLLGPLAAYVLEARHHVVWVAAVIFLAQYLAAALSARWSGRRFVANVLAVQAARGGRSRAKPAGRLAGS